MRALLKTANNELKGRTHEVVHNLVQLMEDAAPREFDQLLTRLKGAHPQVAEVLEKLSNTPDGGDAGESDQNERRRA